MEFKPGLYKLEGLTVNHNIFCPRQCTVEKDKIFPTEINRYYLYINEQCIQNLKLINYQFLKLVGNKYIFCLDRHQITPVVDKILLESSYNFEAHYSYNLILEFLSPIEIEFFKEGLYLTGDKLYITGYTTTYKKYYKHKKFNYNVSYLTKNYLNDILGYIYDSYFKQFLNLTFSCGSGSNDVESYNGPDIGIIKFINPLQQKIMDKLINKETGDVNKELLHSKLLEVSEVLKTEINSDTDLKPRLETLLDMCLDMVNYV